MRSGVAGCPAARSASMVGEYRRKGAIALARSLRREQLLPLVSFFQREQLSCRGVLAAWLVPLLARRTKKIRFIRGKREGDAPAAGSSLNGQGVLPPRGEIQALDDLSGRPARQVQAQHFLCVFLMSNEEEVRAVGESSLPHEKRPAITHNRLQREEWG